MSPPRITLTLREYLRLMGYKTVKMMVAIKNMTPSQDEMENEESLQEIVAKQVAPNLPNKLASSLRYEGEIEEMRALGLGDRSFIDNNHQFENHIRGATNSLQSKVNQKM